MVALFGLTFWVGYYVCNISIEEKLEVEDLSEEGRKTDNAVLNS